MPKHRLVDVVILLRGILGSVLERNGKEVWGPSPGAAIQALWSFGRSIKDLCLTRDPVDQDDLGDDVVATRLVPDVHLIPGFWAIDGYSAEGINMDKSEWARYSSSPASSSEPWHRFERSA